MGTFQVAVFEVADEKGKSSDTPKAMPPKTPKGTPPETPPEASSDTYPEEWA
jgi:hypothetical protein